jgi:DNA-binding CsgD family transcriptional regulator
LWLVHAARAEAAWLDGDDDTARTHARLALDATPAQVSPWLVGDLHRWAHLPGGPPGPAGGDPLTPYESEIRGDWHAAADAWGRRGCPYDAALAQLGGDIAAVQSALDTFRKLGARAAAQRAKQQLTTLRGRTRRIRRTDPQQLSARELEVLTHLAAGRSNAEIAAILHLSPKTVGHHVGAIFTKLGVDNRTQAAAHARQPHPVDEP